jgi:sugar phosphate isomerase/epimerase
MQVNRRHFVAGAAAAAAYTAVPGFLRGEEVKPDHPIYPTRNLPFHLAVINDEISDDLDRGCYVVAKVFGLKFIELRSFWKKNVVDLNDDEIARAKKVLLKYGLAVSDLASPLFKTDFPGGTTAASKVDQFGGKAADFSKQNEVLEKCIHLARSFGTTRIRGFDYVRLADPKPFLPEIHEQLRKASTRMAKDNLIFLLENEQSCNTATGAESARTLAAVQNTNFMLNWDPGNAADAGEVPFPNGYDLLPKNRIGHCHCKDVVKGANGKPAWAAVGSGYVDWRGQIAALIDLKFNHTLSLETHWRGAGTAEASTMQSMAGLQEILGEFSS